MNKYRCVSNIFEKKFQRFPPPSGLTLAEARSYTDWTS